MTVSLKWLSAVILLLSTQVAFALTDDDANNCPANMPKMTQQLENMTIVAGNEANVPTSDAFSGDNIGYSFTSSIGPGNDIKINPRNGNLIITANKQDKFDVTVMAKNECGSDSVTFNVQIDEE